MIYRVEVDLGNAGYGWNWHTATEVYNDLVDVLSEEDAMAVQKWCLEAKARDEYDGKFFHVYVFEDDGLLC